MKTRQSLRILFLLTLAFSLLLIPAAAVEVTLTGSGTAEDPYLAGTAEELTAAIDAGGKIQLTDNISSASPIVIEKEVTIDLNNKTVTFSSDRGFRTTANATFKNGSVVSTASGGRCIETRAGDLTLNLQRVDLTATTGAYTQALTIGGSGTHIIVNIKGGTITAGHYGIITFNPVTMNITDATVTGYGALYAKPANSSVGSEGSEFNVQNSTLEGINSFSYDPSNSFATIMLADDDITLNVTDASTVIADNIGTSGQYILSFAHSVDPADATTGCKVSFGEGVTLSLVNGANGIFDTTSAEGNTTGLDIHEDNDEVYFIMPDTDVTITGQWIYNAPVAVRYKVTADAENGTVSVDARYKRGDTVTFTVTPDAGYVLKSLTITRKSGAEVAYTESNGTYTFKMPAGAVTVNAQFVLAFEDIEDDHQFYDAIEWVYQQNLMMGKTETTFDRVNPVTRQQVWRILARIINGEDPGSMAAAKEWAMAQGIADGTNPGTAATREEFVTMMWIAYGKPAADTAALAAYTDAASISEDAAAAMAWAVSEGIVGGYSDGTLRPAASASRGAFAAILYRYLAK